MDIGEWTNLHACL